jgi:hypothetical protein
LLISSGDMKEAGRPLALPEILIHQMEILEPFVEPE